MPIVKEIMGNRFPVVALSASKAEAARLMSTNEIQMMPVVQNGRLHGILTIEDLLRESPTLG